MYDENVMNVIYEGIGIYTDDDIILDEDLDLLDESLFNNNNDFIVGCSGEKIAKNAEVRFWCNYTSEKQYNLKITRTIDPKWNEDNKKFLNIKKHDKYIDIKNLSFKFDKIIQCKSKSDLNLIISMENSILKKCGFKLFYNSKENCLEIKPIKVNKDKINKYQKYIDQLTSKHELERWSKLASLRKK